MSNSRYDGAKRTMQASSGVTHIERIERSERVNYIKDKRNKDEWDAFTQHKSEKYQDGDTYYRDSVDKNIEYERDWNRKNLFEAEDAITKGEDLQAYDDEKQRIAKTGEYDKTDFYKERKEKEDWRDRSDKGKGKKEKSSYIPKDPHVDRFAVISSFMKNHCKQSDVNIPIMESRMLEHNASNRFSSLKEKELIMYNENIPNSLIFSTRPLSSLVTKRFCTTTKDDKSGQNRRVSKTSICVPTTECLFKLCEFYDLCIKQACQRKIRKWSTSLFFSYIAVSLIRMSLGSMNTYTWTEFAIVSAKMKYLESLALAEAFASKDCVRVFIVLQLPLFIEQYWNDFVNKHVVLDSDGKLDYADPHSRFLTHNTNYDMYKDNTKAIFRGACAAMCFQFNFNMNAVFDIDNIDRIYSLFWYGHTTFDGAFPWISVNNLGILDVCRALELKREYESVGQFVVQTGWETCVMSTKETLNYKKRHVRIVPASSFYNVFYQNGSLHLRMCSIFTLFNTERSMEYFQGRFHLSSNCKTAYRLPEDPELAEKAVFEGAIKNAIRDFGPATSYRGMKQDTDIREGIAVDRTMIMWNDAEFETYDEEFGAESYVDAEKRRLAEDRKDKIAQDIQSELKRQNELIAEYLAKPIKIEKKQLVYNYEGRIETPAPVKISEFRTKKDKISTDGDITYKSSKNCVREKESPMIVQRSQIPIHITSEDEINQSIKNRLFTLDWGDCDDETLEKEFFDRTLKDSRK